jgi:hypothetical protein
MPHDLALSNFSHTVLLLLLLTEEFEIDLVGFVSAAASRPSLVCDQCISVS